jgi:EAL domain-containing protein (putative c-di-GMP-specific phosphodiesterase class I)
MGTLSATYLKKPVLALAGEPVLEFLPAVDLATGRLLALEALVRWDHPTNGRIPPHILLPWAEAHGASLALNAWVVHEACLQAETWWAGIQIAVNCSIDQLRRGEASRAAIEALEASGLNPDRLTIEVAEQAVVDEQAAIDLRSLSDLGIHLAVDDVGTRWPSLQPLAQFAIDTVKIDRPFISSLEDPEGMNHSIVDALIRVSHSLAMSTVAEGVETLGQTAMLRELGADAAQGYFLSRPISPDDARELATTQPPPVYYLGTNAAAATHGSLPGQRYEGDTVTTD